MATSYNLNTQPNAAGGSDVASRPQYATPGSGQMGNNYLKQVVDPSYPQSQAYNFIYGGGFPLDPLGRPITGGYGLLGSNGGMTNVGGQYYRNNSPQLVAAQRANQQAAATAAGQAAGDYTQGAISQIPSLQGLLGATGSAFGGAFGSAVGGGTGGRTGGTGFGGYGVSGGAGTLGAGGGYAPSIQVPDQSQAIAGKFAAAKDTVGKTARAALDSLRGELGATGQLGGGAEGTGVQNVITAGEGQLGDVTRSQAETQAEQALDVAKQNAQLAETSRGQDIGATVAERGQDVQAMEAQARLALENRQQLFQMLGLAMQGLGGRGGAGGGAAGPAMQLY